MRQVNGIKKARLSTYMYSGSDCRTLVQMCRVFCEAVHTVASQFLKDVTSVTPRYLACMAATLTSQ